MFGKLFGAVKSVVKAAVPVVTSIVEPSALLNVAGGMVIKHAGKSPTLNQAIPYISVGASVGFELLTKASEEGWESAVLDGVKRAAMAWAIHRGLKEPLRNIKNPRLATEVGPGGRFSL